MQEIYGSFYTEARGHTASGFSTIKIQCIPHAHDITLLVKAPSGFSAVNAIQYILCVHHLYNDYIYKQYIECIITLCIGYGKGY